MQKEHFVPLILAALFYFSVIGTLTFYHGSVLVGGISLVICYIWLLINKYKLHIS